MKRTFLLLILAGTALAQNTNLISAANYLTLAQSDWFAAQAQIASLTAQVADLQTKTTDPQVTEIKTNCPTCLTTLYNVIHGNTGEVSNVLCCGPTTVPPTPEVPAGTAILYITHEQASR